MACDVLSVANAFLDLADHDKVSVDPLKLQKLVYLAHGWNLAIRDVPLINERVEAWKYGPVVPVLYRHFRQFRANPIDVPHSPRGASNIDEKSMGMVRSVWTAYRPFNSIQLSMLTHEPGSAWDNVRRGANEWISPVIPNELIRQEFLSRKNNGGHLR